MTICFYKRLIRTLEIWYTPVWVFSNIWRLGGIMDTEFSTDVFNKMLLNNAKYQGYSFYRFWNIKTKPTRRGKVPHTPTTPPPRLRLSKIKATKPSTYLRRTSDRHLNSRKNFSKKFKKTSPKSRLLYNISRLLSTKTFTLNLS